MRFSGLVMTILSLLFILGCGDKGTTNTDAGKEIARVFFINPENNIDIEEPTGDPDRRITCMQVTTLGPGIRVIVTDENNRTFRLDLENVQNTGFVLRNGYAFYKDENGISYESNSLQNVEIYWRENLDICEFTFKAQPAPVQLTSNAAQTVWLDSLRIEARREDD